MFDIFLINWGVPPTSRQTQWKFQNIRLIISESRDQCPRYSGTILYALFTLAKLQYNFPEICHFVNNTKGLSDIMPNWVNLSK